MITKASGENPESLEKTSFDYPAKGILTNLDGILDNFLNAPP
jgi:hypothetical protein